MKNCKRQLIDEGLEMRQEKRQSSTIRKRIRRLYRQMRFKFWLAEQDYLICAESLNIRKMLQQNPYLARQISDAGWGEILRQLSYKCAWQHKPFVQIDALFPSTQVCNVCGYRNKALRKRFREQWECPCCGAIHDVDLNAAKNILNEGLRLLS